LQLRQRISIVARLAPFSAAETRAYIEHRLRVAGYRGESALFTDRAYALIAAYSGGIPRNINNLCFNALSLACATQRKTIHAATVEEVLRDLDLEPLYESVPGVSLRPPAAPPAAAATASLLQRVNAILPKKWTARVGLATLGAFLAGVTLTVVAKNPHTAANSASSATAPGTPTATQGTPATQAAAPSAQAGMAATPLPATNAQIADATTVARPGQAVSGLPNARPNFEVVRVERQDTLYEICMDHFGRYDQEVIAMIRELNPGFEGPRRLHIGQDLRIPTLTSLEARTNLSPERLGNTSAAEAKKP